MDAQQWATLATGAIAGIGFPAAAFFALLRFVREDLRGLRKDITGLREDLGRYFAWAHPPIEAGPADGRR